MEEKIKEKFTKATTEELTLSSKRLRIFLVTALSLLGLASGLLFILFAWILTAYADQTIKTVAAAFSGIFGFALGCKAFWKLTDKIAGRKVE